MASYAVKKRTDGKKKHYYCIKIQIKKKKEITMSEIH